jgi:hypothetical protein
MYSYTIPDDSYELCSAAISNYTPVVRLHIRNYLTIGDVRIGLKTGKNYIRLFQEISLCLKIFKNHLH